MASSESTKSDAWPVSGVQRRGVQISKDAFIRTGLFTPDQQLPLVITPAMPEVDLVGWAARNYDFIRSNLQKHGGILFRAFTSHSPEMFARLVGTVAGPLLEYSERSSPRTEVLKGIYTSTDYPPAESIFLHNENSYQRTWPMKIFFYCDTPAETGGETPIADCRRIYESIDPVIRKRFEEKGWMYVRNFSERLGLHWQTVFQTTDQASIEDYCQKNGIEVEWLPDARLRTKARRHAIRQHPCTGERLWFNHAAFFHVSTLPPSIREPLLNELNEDELPAQSYYGDGEPIEQETAEILRASYQSATVSFPWQQGDILLLDNMLVAHGRAPFTGTRKILVSMAEPWSQSD